MYAPKSLDTSHSKVVPVGSISSSSSINLIIEPLVYGPFSATPVKDFLEMTTFFTVSLASLTLELDSGMLLELDFLELLLDFASGFDEEDATLEEEDFSSEAEEVPLEEDDFSSDAEELPLEEEDFSSDAEESPLEEEDFSSDAEDSPLEEEDDFFSDAEDLPLEEEDFSSDAEDFPLEDEDFFVTALTSSSHVPFLHR